MDCLWPGKDELMQNYHREEWGTPLYTDEKIFEFLVLDTFQAGLSWRTILRKRENFRTAFAHFDAHKIASFTDNDKTRLLNDAGIIRNRLKILATINNAQQYLRIQEREVSFAHFIWQFTKWKVLDNQPRTPEEVAVRSTESDKMSAELKKEGFKFVGTTICYAFMQASGMVNDHLVYCSARR